MYKVKKIAAWLLLLGCFALMCFFAASHGTHILDADMSSEMVLAKHLADENKLLSPEWYYSTELRVVNTQLILMPLFKLFDSWVTVRALGTGILLAIYLLCYRFFLGSLGLAKAFPLSGAFLILPLSTVYFVFVVFGLYYIPHICFSFLLMGLMFKIAASAGKSRAFYCAAMCLLALLAGMGGLRQLLVYNIPVLIASASMSAWFIFKREHSGKSKEAMSYFVSSLVTAAFAVAGYLINAKVLAARYSFSSQGGMNYALPGFERTELILKEWLSAFGFTEGPAFTLRTLYNLGCLCLVILIFVALRGILCKAGKYTLGQRLVAMYFAAAALVYSAFIICTDFAHVGRYCLPVAIFALPVICIYFCGLDMKDKLTRRACAAFCAMMLLCGLGKLRNQFQTDTTGELRQITDMLVSEGYTEGYSTFWTGNLVTELSDGEIEMWVLRHSINDLDDIYPWLQTKEHAATIPDGPIFLLFQEYELHDCEFIEALDREKMVYNSDVYTVYCYDSYQQVMDELAE